MTVDQRRGFTSQSAAATTKTSETLLFTTKDMQQSITTAVHKSTFFSSRRRFACRRPSHPPLALVGRRGPRAFANEDCPPSAIPSRTPHSDVEVQSQSQSQSHSTTKPFKAAVSDEDRIVKLGAASLDCGAIFFTKSHSGKYTAVNNSYIKLFGFSSQDEILGKTDEELIETLLAKPDHPMFHHSYRGESIQDLPAIWHANDDSVMSMNKPRWFRERSPFIRDGRLHEFCVMKAPFDGGIVGVGVMDGV
jgi:PAS domain-containing protein